MSNSQSELELWDAVLSTACRFQIKILYFKNIKFIIFDDKFL